MSPLFRRRLKNERFGLMCASLISILVLLSLFFTFHTIGWWCCLFFLLIIQPIIVWYGVFKVGRFDDLKEFSFDSFMTPGGDIFNPHSKHILFKFRLRLPFELVKVVTDGRFIAHFYEDDSSFSEYVKVLSPDDVAYFKSCVENLGENA